MPSFDTISNSCEYGEIRPSFGLRTDLEVQRKGAKKLRNARIISGGGWTRRPGSSWRKTLDADTRIARFTLNTTTKYVVGFSAGAFHAYDLDGVAQGSLSSLPWSAAQTQEMNWEVDKEEIVVTHQGFMPYVITNTGASTWSGASFAFADGIDGQKKQPYYRFAEKGIAITPSARTGSVTLTASDDVFVAGHVGTRFRYLYREIEITSVTDGQNAAGDVVSQLNPTVNLTVGSSANFAVGQEVEGLTSSIRGIVTNIPDSTHIHVLVSTGMDVFDSTEDLAGPDGKTTISAVSTISPAATTVWDEQAFSDVRGYPGSVRKHRRRLIFLDHPSIPKGVFISAEATRDNFDVGDGTDTDAIIEEIGDSDTTRVLHALSAEQLLIFGDNGIYYVPESVDIPITPSTITFLRIAPTGISTAPPVLTDEGALFIDSGQNNVVVVEPTGDPRSSWKAYSISELASHLLTSPSQLAVTVGNAAEPERYAYALNSDGSVAVVFFQRLANSIGWTKWTTEGSVKSIASVDGIIFATTQRTVAGSTVYLLERFSQGMYLDASSAFSTPTGNLPIETLDGKYLTTVDGSYLVTLNSAIPQLAGQTVHLVNGTAYLGEFTVDASGFISGLDDEIGEYEAGFNYLPEYTPFPPSGDFAAGRKTRIVRFWVHVLNSTSYTVEGQRVPSYVIGEDTSALPPQRTEARFFKFLGRSNKHEIDITQPDPGPLTILGVSMEVRV